MNVKPKFVYYDIRRKQSVCLIMYTHENDVDTQVLEVSMLDNGEPIELDAGYTYSAAIVNRETKALINDSISCELNDGGNVLIPIDNFHTLGAQDLLIELTISDSDGNQVLVTPFPLWIHVNASILDDAQVTPESQGTVPELLEDAEKALEDAQQAIEDAGDYENLRNRPIIKTFNDYRQSVLSGVIKLPDGFGMDLSEEGIIKLHLGYISGSKIEGGTVGYEKLDNQFANSLVRAGITDLYTDLNNAGYNSILYISDPTGKINLPVRRAGFAITLTSRDLSQNFLFHVLQIYVTKSPYEDPKVFVRTARNNTGSVVSGGDFSPWTELTRYISSATVNQNGTITFTMSDGSTVTTTGESVIGESAYQVAVDNGFIGTEQEWLASLKGEQGDDYVLTAQDKTDIANIVLSELPTTQGVLYGNSSN